MNKCFVVYLCLSLWPFLVNAQSAKSDRLFVRGVELYNQGNFREAADVFFECAELDSRELPEDSPRNNYSLEWLSSCYFKLGLIEEAREVSPLTFMLDPVDRRQTVESDGYTQAAKNLYERGEYKKAIEYLHKCEETEKKELGENHYFLIGTYNVLCDYYYAANEKDKTLEYLRKEINLVKNVYSSYHSEKEIALYLLSLETSLADFCYFTNNVKEALETLSEAMELAYTVFGSNSEQYADILIFHSDFCYNLANNDLDNERLQKFLKEKEVIASIDTIYAKVAIRLGENFRAQGLYDESLKLFENAESIFSKFSDWNYILELIKQNIIRNHLDTSNYQMAIKKSEEISAHYSKYGVSDTTAYINSLSVQTSVYRRVGDWEKALRFAAEDKELSMAFYGEDNFQYLDSYLNWLDIAINSNTTIDSDNVNETLARLFETMNMKMNEGAIIQETSLNQVLWTLADFLLSMSAVQGFEKNMAILLLMNIYNNLKLLLGDNHNLTLRYLNLLALYQYRIGENYASLSNSNKVISVEREMYGFVNPISLYNNGLSWVYANNYENGYNRMSEALKLYKDQVFNDFRWMVGSERANYWKSYEQTIDGYYLVNYIGSGKDKLPQLAYDASLFQKSLLLSSDVELRSLLLEQNNSTVIAVYSQWQELEQRISRLSGNINQHSSNVYKQMLKESEELERRLMQMSSTFGDYTNRLNISSDDVKNALKNDEVAIEFVSFQYSNDSILYFALVQRPSYQIPHYIFLFEEKELSNLLKGDYYGGTALYDLIWKPLDDELNNTKIVYFSPTGQLHSIGIEYLLSDNNKRIFEEYEFFRLSSTRELVSRSDSSPITNAVLFGGLKYRLTKSEREQTENELRTEKSDDYKTVNDTPIIRGGFTLKELEGSRIEVSFIDSLLQKEKVKVSLRDGRKGTEDAFKRLSGNKISVLHISTHGFYETKETGINNQMANYNAKIDYSLSKSGLYLSGALDYMVGSKSESHEDGVLTAREVSTMNFKDLGLVVLSACETGLGDISSEGVFGLQRGFKKAGAHSILMSLWKVDDDATRILMSEFYHGLMKGYNTHDALREAQKFLMKISDEYQNPFYWAAFILMD